MELFIHTPGNEHPEIIEIEATALVRDLLVESDPDGHVWLEEVDEEINLDITLRGGRHPAPPPCAPGPLPPGRGRRPVQRQPRARLRPGHDHQDRREVGVRRPRSANFSPEQAAKHVLAVPGADHFLEDGVHIGSLVTAGHLQGHPRPAAPVPVRGMTPW